MTTTPLWLDLDGAHNVRDVGGLRAGERRVRPGVLLRSDHLEDLTAAGAAQLCDVTGLRAIVDLRAPSENPLAGAWMDGRAVNRLHLPLIDLTQSFAPHVTPDGEPDYVAAYRQMLTDAAGPLVQILRFVVTDGHTPALVHCAAGKDRTGITVAVLLAAAGVDEADIVADYVVTGLRLDRVRTALIRRGGYPEDMVVPEPALLDAEPIEAVLAALTGLGGAAAFLRDNGATDAELSTWRSLIVE